MLGTIIGSCELTSLGQNNLFAHDHSILRTREIFAQLVKKKRWHAFIKLCVLWYVTFQWPGRAASFESQGSCPSPKPAQTPWRSQVEWQHHRCEERDVWVELRRRCVAYESLVSLLWKLKLFQHIFFFTLYISENKVVLELFLFFKCSTELAMHSTDCNSIHAFIFHWSDWDFTERLYLHIDHMDDRPHCET